MRKFTSCASVAALLLAVSAAAAFGQATIQIGSSDGSGSVDITLATGGAAVAGTENVITFGPEVVISSCAINPDIKREASAFSFSPSGCDDEGSATPCESLKSLVLSFSNTDPLADGVTLYTCDVVVNGGTPPGDYDLTCESPGGSDPDGNVVDTTCTSGVVSVADVPVANLNIGSTTIEPGSAGTIEVTLDLLEDGSAQVAATENVISFAPETQIARCTVNPDINREASAFSLSPSDCSPGVNCESIKALVLSFSDLTPLPDGTLLYTCDVVSVPAGSASATVSGVAAGTAEGVFPLTCSAPGSSDPDGNPLSTTCSDGQVEVIAPTPVPTATPTRMGVAGADLTEDLAADATELTVDNVNGTIPPNGIIQIDDERITYSGVTDNGDGSFTLTGLDRGAQGTTAAAHDADARVDILEAPDTPTPTATATDTPGTPVLPTIGSPDDDGCSVVDPKTGGSGWMLLLPMAGLLWLRRKQ